MLKNRVTVVFNWLCCALLSLNLSAQALSPQENARFWATRLADSMMAEFPEVATMRKSDGAYRWAYVQGLVLKGYLSLNEIHQEKKYENYVKAYLDRYIDKDGRILTYHMDEFNIDSINSGKLLFYFYSKTEDPRYLIAMKTLIKQLAWHPRTRAQVFWHKGKYPWQIWLDGLYMAAPFYAQYDKQFNRSQKMPDVINQFTQSYKLLLDSNTGLFFHGYDESRIQKWSNPETGLSKQIWGRALGWYAMALVDTIEHVGNTRQRQILKDIIQPFFASLLKYQDKKSGLWYQVPNRPGEEGNYLESSSSAMFIYSFSKAHRLGLLDVKYRNAATKAFNGFLDQKLLQFDEKTAKIILHNVCRSAGLGGKPYRDGSYDYYVNQTDRVTNDAHGLGSLLLALTELAKSS